MSTNDSPADKGSAGPDACNDYTTKLLPRHVHLGVDREGYRHHLDRDADVVWRFGGADVERVTPLDGKHLDTYLAFVADGVGWDTRKQAANWDFYGGRR